MPSVIKTRSTFNLHNATLAFLVSLATCLAFTTSFIAGAHLEPIQLLEISAVQIACCLPSGVLIGLMDISERAKGLLLAVGLAACLYALLTVLLVI